MSPPLPKVRCRQIGEVDLDQIADLLAVGFPARPRNYWARGLATLARRPAVDACPRFGYLLEAEGRPVGVILLIFADMGGASGSDIRCNVSSWYVRPAFRSFAPLLIAQALKLKHVTYINVSPAEHTWPILDAQGYRRYANGQFVCVPALSPPREGDRVRAIGDADAALPEIGILRAHAETGCLSLVCETRTGPLPFVFLPRRIAYAPVGMVQLAYCRDTSDFAACAGALGRYLLGRGVAAVICDAEAPLPGLVGWYFRGRAPKYFKGARQPRLNDLAFTEAVLFGA